MRFLKLFEEFTQEGQVVAKIGNTSVKLKIPTTEAEKRKGYMFSEGPMEDEGMLFVYPNESILTFWMKNVDVPLDIIFFDSNMNIVDYKKMSPYKEGGEEVYYSSNTPARFAIELPAGWIDKNLNQENLWDYKLKF